MDEKREISRLVVDLAVDTGALKYGASGFLYGLGNAGIPSGAVLAPLKPRVAAQKPEGGLQHPNGDALDVAETYRAAGGKEIEIYLQDAYPSWPYDQLGMADYLEKIRKMVRQASESPNAGLFSYVPFNEPDQIWYNKTDKKDAFFANWLAVYRAIRAVNPSARIVGPNFASYDSACYRDFMAFALANACLPEVVSWHELNQDFFAGWAGRFADFRSIEIGLGLPAREICINEYGRIKGDLGIPGRLVQWIARFEDNKVDACLAYWTDAGSLNNLVTRDHPNKATGGWWLYRSYAGMTGHTVKVSSPDPFAEGLQGLAAFDPEQSQVRILFGGSSGPVQLVVDGFSALPCFKDQVHAALWSIDSSGLNPSAGPVLGMATELPVDEGRVKVGVENLVDSSAYLVILSPSGARARPGAYPAVYADLSGSARAVYGDRGAWVEMYQPGQPARTSFVVTALDNGYHTLRLDYSTGPGKLRMTLNGDYWSDRILPAAQQGEEWASIEWVVFLAAGINQIGLETHPESSSNLQIRDLSITPADGPVWSYSAASPVNLLTGKPLSRMIQQP